MTAKIRVLFVDDEERFLETTSTRLRMRGLEVDAFTRPEEALEAAKGARYDVALVDLKMPGMDGGELLKKLKQQHPFMEVVILTGHGSIASAVECTRDGAYEFLQKPCELDEVISVLSMAYGKRIVARKAHRAQKVQELLENAVGYSPIALLEALRQIDKEESDV